MQVGFRLSGPVQLGRSGSETLGCHAKSLVCRHPHLLTERLESDVGIARREVVEKPFEGERPMSPSKDARLRSELHVLVTSLASGFRVAGARVIRTARRIASLSARPTSSASRVAPPT